MLIKINNLSSKSKKLKWEKGGHRIVAGDYGIHPQLELGYRLQNHSRKFSPTKRLHILLVYSNSNEISGSNSTSRCQSSASRYSRDSRGNHEPIEIIGNGIVKWWLGKFPLSLIYEKINHNLFSLIQAHIHFSLPTTNKLVDGGSHCNLTKDLIF